MQETCDRIISGIREAFPETGTMTLTAESTLGAMPDWDSMAAVNLQTFLQNHFQIEVPLELLVDETAIKEIAGFIHQTVGNEVS